MYNELDVTKVATAVAAALKVVNDEQPTGAGQVPHNSLAAKMGYGSKQGRKATGNPAGPYLHGPGGLAAGIDGEHPILSAMIRPQGLLSVLPILRADRHVTEFVTTFTGVTKSTGSEPEEVCDDPREAGLKKLCRLAIPFGRQRLKTREWHLLRLGKLANRFEELSLGADFPIGLLERDNLTPFAGTPTVGADVMRSELANRLFEMAIEFQRTLAPQVYTGDPANNTGSDPDTAGYKEFQGLDLWINAGNKRDATSMAVCKALDSLMMDFGGSTVNGTKSIVRYITQAWRWVNWNARAMGLAPATWVIAMRPDLFFAVADIWPCAYLSANCNVDGGATNILAISDDTNVRLRDEMRTGSFLWIDGQRVQVVLDDSIAEETFADGGSSLLDGQYSSDIYIVPLTVLGGLRVTGFQYFDQRLSVAENMITRLANFWTTDNGMFLWNSTFKDLCLDMRATVEARLIMQTPQLGARIQNVVYAPDIHLRESNPDALYYSNGGVTSTEIERFYNAWSSTPAAF